MQGNVIPPPPIYGSKRSPISDCYNAMERHMTIVRGPNLNVAFPHLWFYTLTTESGCYIEGSATTVWLTGKLNLLILRFCMRLCRTLMMMMMWALLLLLLGMLTLPAMLTLKSIDLPFCWTPGQMKCRFCSARKRFILLAVWMKFAFLCCVLHWSYIRLWHHLSWLR